MMECWKIDPLERPSFESLRSLIHGMIRDEEQVRIRIPDLKVTLTQGDIVIARDVGKSISSNLQIISR